MDADTVSHDANLRHWPMTYHIQQSLVVEFLERLDDVWAIVKEPSEAIFVARFPCTKGDLDRILKSAALDEADNPEAASTELGEKRVPLLEQFAEAGKDSTGLLSDFA
jgi:hypothetical protein